MIIYKGRLINLKVLKRKIEIIEHPGAVVIIPVVDNSKILMIKQYRFAVKKTILELPAGTLEKGESKIECARRELEEETGYKAKYFKKLLSFYSSPGFCTEKMHLFIASKLSRGVQNMDEDENISVVKIGIKKAIEMIKKNEIIDSKTIIGLLYYYRRRRK